MPRHMAVIKCKYLGIVEIHGGQRLMCLVDGALPGNETMTSQLKTIDFERGMAVTQNNIYVWDAPK